MPVRSSLCTYSPMAASGAMGGRNSSTSKYSSILPTSGSLSYGHYKPLSSGGHSSSGSSNSPATSARYNRLNTSSPSSYSPASSSSYLPSSPSSSTSSFSSATSTSSSAGLYRPLGSTRVGPSWRSESATASASATATSTPPSRLSSGNYHHTSPRYSSSSSTGSLASTSSSGSEHLSGSTYQSYKPASGQSSLSSSAYSSGSSLSSNSSTSYTSPYLASRQSRRLSTEQSTAASGGTALPADAPSGLMNLGNTCYMNASLQALYSLESFRNLLLSSDGHGRRHSDKVLTGELAELFKLMRDSSSQGQRSPHQTAQPTSPANFKFAFSRHQSKFSGFGQQDAQEFLRYLIDGIHEECNVASKRPRHQARPAACPKSAQEAWAQYREIVDDSPLVELLVGQLCSTITCSECRNKSHCWDPFWDLSLPLPVRYRGGLATSSSSSGGGSLGSWRSYYSSQSSSTTSRLSDVIEEFTSPEVLDSDERPVCAHCKRPTKSTKQISLARLPRVLILHLKKFTNDGYKLTSPEIQIDKHLTFNGTSHYQLKACISHHGHSSSSGHYTSHCEYSSRWLHFDDSRVRDVTSGLDCSKLEDAYVLFYTQQHQSRRPSSESTSISQSKL